MKTTQRQLPATCAGIALCIAMSGFALPSAVAAETAIENAVDRIAATVNDDIITERELNQELERARRSMKERKIALPPESILRQQVLGKTIIDRLQSQLAEATGLKTSDQEIDNAIEQIRKRNNLTDKKLRQQLERDNLTMAEYREQVRDQLLQQKLVEREVKRRIHVSEAEVSDFLENTMRANTGDSYEVSHILLPLPENATTEIIKALATKTEGLVKQLRNGADFKTVAASHSKGPRALEGGYLGWRQAGQLPAVFVEELERMKPGEVSEPVRSANGFHILKLDNKRSSKKSKIVTQVRARHILIATNAVMPEAEARNKIEQLRDRILGGGDFTKVAQAHSEDPGSSAQGGKLDWMNPGQTVPEFDKALQTQKIGVLGPIIKSDYGFHIIEVLERRQQDIGELLDRAEARNQIVMRKSEERYQQWLRELQDEAYIQILIDGQ
ncbi:MAG: peptidylprolyl isomerase [Gammaproteobacteria bacterium]|nr:peptidylprolyl isomerase [Gammaproteobacteria bacterium]